MKFSITKLYLVAIFLFFILTRIYKISDIPQSVYWDEASIGVNGYSIAQTGKDEWGKFLPLNFKAFGEYKLPVYIYTTALSVKIFGLNEFAVRIPAVLFSLGVVLLGFLLAIELTKDHKVGLLTAFFITISQWFFIISRTGFEATAGLLFFISGIYFFVKAIGEKKILFVVSCISFVLTLYSYNSFLIITPITLLLLAVFYFKKLSSFAQGNLMISIICLLILFTGGFGTINFILSGQSARLDDVGIFIAYNQKKYQTLTTVISNYLSHFSPTFLFFKGDGNGRSQQPEFGPINLIYLPLLILGVIDILQKKKREYNLILLLLLIAPIPASITRESPHALRSIAAIPFISFISALGVLKVALFIKSKYTFSVVICLFLISFLFYFKNFILNYTKKTANDWQYIYKKINLDYRKEFDNFDYILISDRYNQPYIFTLFYLRYDPDKFRSEVKYNQTIRKATSLVGNFNKFIFTNIDYFQLPRGKSLIFTHPSDKMDEIKWRETILNPDGSIGGYVYEYKK